MTASAAEEETNVRVAARVRPLLSREKADNCCQCITVHRESRQLVLGPRRAFAFDFAFEPGTSQLEVYDNCAAPLLSGCLQGYNATILAYGQTGSGKTFTMGMGHTASKSSDDEGITPRVVRNSFEEISRQLGEVEFKASCSYLEIYNEEIRDLLQPGAPRHSSIAVRENTEGVIQVAGIHAEQCASAEDMLRCLADGSVQRTTGATLMNEQSSRSHSIFTIIFEQRRLRGGSASAAAAAGDGAGAVAAEELSYRTAKFHLVDLAGSERAKRTGAVGSRLKESVSINTGLLALGNVISALGDPAKRGSHVPYRESKLTRILQDSLGGNSRTCMVACASGADRDFEETLNCLKYAHRARNIKNRPVVNHDPRVAQLAAMQDEIDSLRSQLQRVSDAGRPPSPGADGDCRMEVVTELGEKLEAAEQRGLELAEKLSSLEDESAMREACLRELYLAVCVAAPVLANVQGGNGGAGPRRGSATSPGGAAVPVPRGLAAVWEAARAAHEVLSVRGGGLPELPALPALSGAGGGTFPAEDFGSTSASAAGVGAAGVGLGGTGVEAWALSSGVDQDPALGLTAGDLSARLSTLTEARKDAMPLVRKYLDDIKRLEERVRSLESDLAQKRKESKRLRDELAEAKEDLQKDEEIFEEKMEELKLLVERNRALEAENQELTAYRTGGGRPASVASLGGASAIAALRQPLATQIEDGDEVLTDEPPLPPEVRRSRGAGGDRTGGRDRAALDASSDGTALNGIQAQLAESHGTQAQLETELRTLAQNVSLKEDQINELVRSEQEWSLAKAQYQKRMEQLQQDLDLMRAALEQLQGQRHEESEHLKEQTRQLEEERRILEKRISEQVECIRKSKQEFSRLRELRVQDRARIRDLEAEVQQLTTCQSDVETRLATERRRTARLEELKGQQVTELKQQLAREGQRVRELEAENQRHRERLRRSDTKEQATPVARKGSLTTPTTRGSGSGGATASTPNAASAGAAGAGVSPGGNGGGSATPLSARAHALEQHISNHIRRHEAAQDLQEDIKKRDALLMKLSQYDSYRRKLSAKDATSTESTKDRLKQLEAQIARLERGESPGAAEPGSASAAEAGEAAQIEALQAERAELQRSAQKKHADTMNLMRDIEERLEALQDEVDFREARISKAQQQLRPGSASGAGATGRGSLTGASTASAVGGSLVAGLNLDAEIASIPAEDAKEMLVRYCEKFLRLRQREKQTSKRLAAAEAVLEERTRQVNEVQEALKRQDANKTKALAKVTKEYEGRIRILLRQLGNAPSKGASEDQPQGLQGGALDTTTSSALASGIDAAELEKLRAENQYYRDTNRELKRRLRSSLERSAAGVAGAGSTSGGAVASSAAAGGEASGGMEEMAAQVVRLEREKEALSEEHSRVMSQMHSLKQYSSRFQNISPGASIRSASAGASGAANRGAGSPAPSAGGGAAAALPSQQASGRSTGATAASSAAGR
eukprot:TRINITY_DN14398_c3_g1_i1.p1 TRINITY_DN14398_c3_g1~~TRINITY_DN14398_c3_g1_i1.p1  ORF type:complete len:1472 (-),score=390.41 TRINITY_DN14398_c3_g1_i1:135-4550(-)